MYRLQRKLACLTFASAPAAAGTLTANSLGTGFHTVRPGLNRRFGGSSGPLK